MPSASITFAKWMPAVAFCGSGKWISSAASRAARRTSGVETSGFASAERTAIEVRTVPRWAMQSASAWPSVRGWISTSFSRTSCDSPPMAA